MVSVPTPHSVKHSCSNPVAALRRDSLFNKMDKSQLHGPSCIPLTDTLSRLIQAQRDLQNTLMQNYDALKIRHRKLVAEYEQLCARDSMKAVMKLTTENKVLRQRLDEEIQLRINLEHTLREVTLSLSKKVERLTRNHMLAVQPDSTFEPLTSELDNTMDAGFDIHSGSIEPSQMEMDAEVSLDRINLKTAVTTFAHDGTEPFKSPDDVQSDRAEPTDLKQKKPPVVVHINLVGEWPVVYSRNGTALSKYIHEMRIGTTQIRHDCTWSELDTTLVTSARARIKYVTQRGGLRRINCVADTGGNAESPQNYCISNSRRESDTRNLGYRLGNISWVDGSPPTYNKAQRSTNDGMDDSAGGNIFGKEELRPVDVFLQVTKISHESSVAVNNMDASQPIPLVIQFHPITGVALECGLTECYVQNCLDLLSRHSGLIWYSQTAVVWTRRVLHLMAGLTMLELSDNPKSQLTQHIVTLSEQTKPDSFRFILWLLSQNLVSFKEETDDIHQSHPQRTVLLVLESLHFLNDPQNLSDFLHFFGVTLPGSEQADWCSCTTDILLLAATDHMPPFHKLQPIGHLDENQWFVWPLVAEDSKPSKQQKRILIHQLSLFKEPLSGVVPALLRFAGLRCAPRWDEKLNRTIRRGTYGLEKAERAYLHTDVDKSEDFFGSRPAAIEGLQKSLTRVGGIKTHPLFNSRTTSALQRNGQWLAISKNAFGTLCLRPEDGYKPLTRERNDANQILFDWIEQIWFRLIEIVTLIGRDPSKLLQHHSELNDCTSPVHPASNDSIGDVYTPDSNGLLIGSMECQKSSRTNVPTMGKLTDQDFVVAALDILNPDVFITCPLLSHFRFKTVVQEVDILRWLERSWNGIWEPGLQACVTPDPTNPESGTIADEWATMAKRQSRNAHFKSNRPRSEESDIAATWFVRSIIMPGCPLKNLELQQFISRLTGGSELIGTRTLVTRQQILDTLVTLHPASALKERTIAVPDRTVTRVNVVNTTEARRTVERVNHLKPCERAKNTQMQSSLNKGESDAKQMISTEPSQTKRNKTYRSVCQAKTNAASDVTNYSIITKSSCAIPQRAQSIRYSKIGQEGRIDTSHTPIRRIESAKSSHKSTFKRPMSFDT